MLIPTSRHPVLGQDKIIPKGTSIENYHLFIPPAKTGPETVPICTTSISSSPR